MPLIIIINEYSRVLSPKVVSWYAWIQKILEKMKPKKKKKRKENLNEVQMPFEWH